MLITKSARGLDEMLKGYFACGTMRMFVSMSSNEADCSRYVRMVTHFHLCTAVTDAYRHFTINRELYGVVHHNTNISIPHM